MTVMFAMCILNMGYIVGNLVPDRVFAIQVSAILVLPTSILGGYTYPISGMPHGFQVVTKRNSILLLWKWNKRPLFKTIGIASLSSTS
ncbi:MAG: ABC transporter permease [Aminipila sp.]